MEWTKYEKSYKVHVYETGPDGKANLFSLLNYMQDIASEHAVVLGFGRDDLMKNNHFWVLSRMFAQFHYWPLWNEDIIVRTWPNGTDKLFAMRNYELVSSSGQRISEGTSSWLIIDKTTKKIQRPDQQHERFRIPFNHDDSPVRVAEKLHDPLSTVSDISQSKVKISDLDMNLHTNNVNYIRWIYDTYNLDFILQNQPASVEINYLAESISGDEIIIKTSETEQGKVFNHSIIRKIDNKDLCRIQVVWKKIE